MPSVDLVRIRDGQSETVNIKEGYDDPEVSARALGFKVIIEKFQHKVSLLYDSMQTLFLIKSL